MLNFSPDEQQLLIAESLAKFLEKNYDFETRKNILEQQQGCSDKVWSTFAELGWLAIPFSEEVGGLGGGAGDLSVFMQALGGAMLLEPYFESVVMAAKVLELCSDSNTAQDLLEKTIAGEAKCILAIQEQSAQFSWKNTDAVLTEVGNDFELTATKKVVVHAQHADFFIVNAQFGKQQAICVVDANAKGISLENYSLMDGKTASTIIFDKVMINKDALLIQQDNLDALAAAVDHWSSIALAAEAVGIMRALIEKTVAYTKTRKQFGFQISFFQALQHRMIDMDLAYEQSYSLLFRAINAFDNSTDTLALEIAALRTYIAKAGKKVAEEAIQLHGGMGLTDELDIGHYAKRLLMINSRFGNEIEYQQKFCKLAYSA